MRGLLHDEVTDFKGEHFVLTDARCEPRPVQAHLPIWIGGGGEKRTLKIAARYADECWLCGQCACRCGSCCRSVIRNR